MIEEKEYNDSAAAKVISKNIPVELKEKLSIKKIKIIIDAMFLYMEDMGLFEEIEGESIVKLPIEINTSKLIAFISGHCIGFGILLSYEEFEDILEAEYIYEKEIGPVETPAPPKALARCVAMAAS